MGPVDEGLSHIADLEDRGRLDVIPVLPGEGVDHLLLSALLASFGEALKEQKSVNPAQGPDLSSQGD